MTRTLAWRLLRSGNPAPLREVDRVAAEHGLDERDRGLLRRLIGTEVRRRGTLRAIVRTFVPRQPKPELLTHLHLGLVQLLFLDRVPDHAAVSETLGAVADTVSTSKVPFVNGVLRTILRARQKGSSGDPRRDLVGRDLHLDREVFRDPARHPYLWFEDALSIPAPLAKRWDRRLRRGPAEHLARYFLEEPPLVLRAVRVERDAVLAELQAEGVEARAGGHERSIVCPSDATGQVTGSAAFREGRLTIQGETALRAGLLLEPRPGERLLELCAAPGGKTAVLAEAGAEVVACDLDSRRLERAADNLARLGLAESVRLVVSDGAAAVAPGTFAGVLVDTPCTNTGVLGARPSARWRFSPGSLRALGELQRRLLGEAAERVEPGGRLVWSTCSLEPEENGRLVRTFLSERPGWELEAEDASVPDAAAGPWDGGYAARLRSPV